MTKEDFNGFFEFAQDVTRVLVTQAENLKTLQSEVDNYKKMIPPEPTKPVDETPF